MSVVEDRADMLLVTKTKLIGLEIKSDRDSFVRLERQIRDYEKLMAEIGRIAEVAGYLWEKGWAERNGGNISVNVTELLTAEEKALPALGEAIVLEEAMTELAGHIFYVTGTGKRMRYVAQDPFGNGSIIRVAADGKSYEIIAEQRIIPTSELPSHLLMHLSHLFLK